MQNSQLEPAVKTYKAILKRDLRDIKGYNTLGDLHIRKKMKKEGFQEYLVVAGYYQKDRFFLRSIETCQKILNIDSQMMAMCEKLADFYSEQKLVAEANSQYLMVADYLDKHGDIPSTPYILPKLAFVYYLITHYTCVYRT